MRSVLEDLRYALRGVRRNPGLTAVALLSLALGIGANTAIFSLVNALILRVLPVRDPQALVLFGPGTAAGNNDNFPNGDMSLFSYPMYRELEQRTEVFSGVAAFSSFEYRLHGTTGTSGGIEPMNVQLVSGTYFSVLGVNPALGRLLTDADDRTLGGHPVAVISHWWWTSRFSGDPAVIGRTVEIGATLYTIIGVAPAQFTGVTVGMRPPDLWIPLQMEESISRGPHKLYDRLYQSLDILARLKPGVTLAKAGAGVNVVFKAMLREYAGSQPGKQRLEDIRKAHIRLKPAATGISFLRRAFSEPLWMLMGVVGLVLLIACANIANLLLARGTTRRREIALRIALGAGRARLMRQLLTESLLLGCSGGAVGVLFAAWAGRLLVAKVSSGMDAVALDVSLDIRVLGFSLLLSLATSILFGILPALRATRVELTPALKEGRGAVSSAARTPLAKTLLASQVALSLVLLVGAGLLVRSLVNLVNVNPGFDQQDVLLFQVDPSATGRTDPVLLDNVYREVEDRVSAIPGVRAASFSIFSFGHGMWHGPAWTQGNPSAPRRSVSYNAVGPGYFAAMGLPILAGRDFSRRDTAASPRVAVINETMARQFFSGGSPIGKRFGMTTRDHSNDIEVVGVVRDAKYGSLDETPMPAAYYPYCQYLPSWGIGLFLSDFEVRVAGDPLRLASRVRRVIASVDARLPVTSVRTMEQVVERSITYQRLVAQLSTFFGLLAVFLACIGIYGLMSYAVSRRTNEIGIRMALGARARDVRRMVVREVVVVVTAGLGIGIPAALAATRWISSLLFGLKPADPATIAAAVLLLLAVAALAGYLPARRASKVDPMLALRYE